MKINAEQLYNNDSMLFYLVINMDGEKYRRARIPSEVRLEGLGLRVEVHVCVSYRVGLVLCLAPAAQSCKWQAPFSR